MASETPKPATLNRLPDDPLGYDTDDPFWMVKMARHAMSGMDKDAIQREVDAAMRRWGMQTKSADATSAAEPGSFDQT